MRIVNAACFCLLVALSVVAFQRQPDVRQTRGPLSERRDRFPVVEENETEPADPVKLARLSYQPQLSTEKRRRRSLIPAQGCSNPG